MQKHDDSAAWRRSWANRPCVSTAMALAGFFNATSSFAVQFVFPWQLSNMGSAAIFFVYSAPGLVAFLLLAWLLPETKGESLEELELLLAGKP
ncbi:MAG: MFS transporter [Xanthomonadales bacterium]|nr:MFS transporter [Xanthomonadales bacterium]MDH3925688.1 MFS transporter [Xanthomonadales bacterium]MDH3999632.1 MFS transporter [Xanthomonadales bacterium]